MTPQRPRPLDSTPNADDRSGPDESTTGCTTGTASNPVDARLNERLAAVSRWNALFVGALTVALAQEVAARLRLGNTASALALLPITLALLHCLLTVAAALERR